jgi:peroxiredoxin
LIKDHSVTLNGLPLQATIHYKVTSRDAAGNEAASPDTTFTTPPASGTGIGQMAPGFSLPGTDGSTISLSSLRGSKVIVNFWAYNCSPCRSEMPLIQQMHDTHSNIPVIAVCGPQLGAVNRYQVGELITSSNFTFTVALDESGQVGSAYNISSVPKTFMIDSNGIVKKIQDGSFSSLSQIETLFNSY